MAIHNKYDGISVKKKLYKKDSYILMEIWINSGMERRVMEQKGDNYNSRRNYINTGNGTHQINLLKQIIGLLLVKYEVDK